MLVDGACYAYSLVTVPLYDTLGPDAVRFICSHAELAAIACSSDCLATLLPCLADTPTVQLVVCAISICRVGRGHTLGFSSGTLVCVAMSACP